MKSQQHHHSANRTSLFISSLLVILIGTSVGDSAAPKVCVNSSQVSSFMSAEHLLLTCLTSRVDTAVRPVLSPKDVVNVSLDMGIIRIIGLDEIDGTLDFTGWMIQTWNDPRLTWKPEDYEGIETIRIPVDRIWTPNIILLNTAETRHSYVTDMLAVVGHNGAIHWTPHLRMRSLCRLDLSRFPFDTQSCGLIFGSWSYDKTKLNLHLKNNQSLNAVWGSREWDFMNVRAKKEELLYIKAAAPYTTKNGSVTTSVSFPFIEYTIVMMRRGTFYGTFLVAPAVLLNILTISMFLVPAEAGQRINLGIGIILTITILMTFVEHYIPPAIDGMPLLFVYLLFNFTMVTIALVVSIMILNMYHRSAKKEKSTDWLRSTFFGTLRSVCCLKSETYNVLQNDVTFSDLNASDATYDSHPTEMEPSPGLSGERNHDLDEIKRYLRVLANNNRPAVSMTSHRQMLINEWQQLAVIIDRIMLWLFIIVTFLAAIIILHH